jgi:hypothetical protein
MVGWLPTTRFLPLLALCELRSDGKSGKEDMGRAKRDEMRLIEREKRKTRRRKETIQIRSVEMR